MAFSPPSLKLQYPSIFKKWWGLKMNIHRTLNSIFSMNIAKTCPKAKAPNFVGMYFTHIHNVVQKRPLTFKLFYSQIIEPLLVLKLSSRQVFSVGRILRLQIMFSHLSSAVISNAEKPMSNPNFGNWGIWIILEVWKGNPHEWNPESLVKKSENFNFSWDKLWQRIWNFQHNRNTFQYDFGSSIIQNCSFLKFDYNYSFFTWISIHQFT